MKVVRLDEIDPIPVVGGELKWRPLRRALGIGAFGINAYTANAGDLVVEEHDETGGGAGHHEELYVVSLRDDPRFSAALGSPPE